MEQPQPPLPVVVSPPPVVDDAEPPVPPVVEVVPDPPAPTMLPPVPVASPPVPLPPVPPPPMPPPPVPPEPQTPLVQVPLVQGVPSGLEGLPHSPVAASHLPTSWHSSIAMHTTAAPPQTPAVQVSVVVQASPSSQTEPSATWGSEHIPVMGSQVPGSWQASLAAQTTGLSPVQAPAVQLSGFGNDGLDLTLVALSPKKDDVEALGRDPLLADYALTVGYGPAKD